MAAELPSPVWEDQNKLHSTSGRPSVSQGKSQCWVIQWGKPSAVEILVFAVLLVEMDVKMMTLFLKAFSVYHQSLTRWNMVTRIDRDVISSTVKLLDVLSIPFQMNLICVVIQCSLHKIIFFWGGICMKNQHLHSSNNSKPTEVNGKKHSDFSELGSSPLLLPLTIHDNI